MRRLLPLLGVLAVAVAAGAVGAWQISEVVTDPQTDWNEDGRVSALDEFVELRNHDGENATLAGWRLEMEDSTPESYVLADETPPGQTVVVWNPPGSMNNDVRIVLKRPDGSVADAVQLGQDVVDGNAAGVADESVARDQTGWGKGHATPYQENRMPYVRISSAARDGWVAADQSVTHEIDIRSAFDDVREVRWTFGATNGSAMPEAAGEARWLYALATPPGLDARLQGEIVGDAGPIVAFEGALVRVDASPPEGVLIEAPAWTNQSIVGFLIHPGFDNDSGGVEYALSSPGSAWSAKPPPGEIDLSSSGNATIVVLARDAVGNEAVFRREVRKDVVPPERVTFVVDEASGEAVLRWATANDTGSGIESLEIVRSRAGSTDRFLLPANATSWTDSSTNPIHIANYSLVAVDRAGNRSPPTSLAPALEVHRPHIRQIRLSDAVWGPDALRIHVDFDRAMDADVPPRAALKGSQSETLLDGRWLANSTTYRIDLPESGDHASGLSQILVTMATDRQGRSLWRPASVPIVIDHEAPSLRANDVEGWVGPAGLRLDAVDRETASWLRWKAGVDWDRSESNATSIRILGPTAIEAYAEDQATRRSPSWKKTVRLDDRPPEMVLVEANLRGIIVDVWDNESGLASAAVNGRGITMSRRLSVPWENAGMIHVVVHDRVSNRASWNWTLAAPNSTRALESTLSEPASLQVGRSPEATASDVENHWGNASWGLLSLPPLGLAAQRLRRRRRAAPNLKSSR